MKRTQNITTVTLALNCDFNLYWIGFSYKLCHSSWYSDHRTKVSQKKNPQAIQEIWSGHEKLMDRQTDAQTTSGNIMFLQAYKQEIWSGHYLII